MHNSQFTYNSALLSGSPSSQRLDIFLSSELGISRTQVKKIIDQGLVNVNGKLPKKAGDFLKDGDVITMSEPEETSATREISVVEAPVALHVDIIAETSDYLVVNKPAGMLVHPTEAHEKYTLTDWLRQKYPDIAQVGESVERPGIVHRLDKEASGLLVVAKTQDMFEHLKKQFQERTIQKKYGVLVYGTIEADHGIIDFDIDRGKDGHMVARPRADTMKLSGVRHAQPGKESLTEFWVEKRLSRFTYLSVQIHTGRMHQIRVHMFAYGHPVVGDTLYVNKKLIKKNDTLLDRLFLHAQELTFMDLDGVEKRCSVGLPQELETYLGKL